MRHCFGLKSSIVRIAPVVSLMACGGSSPTSVSPDTYPTPAASAEAASAEATPAEATPAAPTPAAPTPADLLRECKFPTPEETAALAEDAKFDEWESSGKVRKVPGGSKAIYGYDNRLEYFETSNSASLDVKRLSKAVALVTGRTATKNDDSYVERSGGDRYRLHASTFKESLPPNLNWCASEMYLDQPKAGYCTAFLIAGDMVATAAHCLLGTDPKDMAFVFGYHLNSAKDQNPGIPNDHVFFGKEIYDGKMVYPMKADQTVDLGASIDWALVRLDRKVPASVADPLPLRRAPASIGEEVGVIGHPNGLPAKFSFSQQCREGKPHQCMVTVKSVSGLRFQASLDATGGNSGGPVFDMDGKVLGILVTGPNKNYELVFDTGGKCVRSARYSDRDGQHEATGVKHWIGITSIAQFSASLPSCALAPE